VGRDTFAPHVGKRDFVSSARIAERPQCHLAMPTMPTASTVRSAAMRTAATVRSTAAMAARRRVASAKARRMPSARSAATAKVSA